MELFKNKSKGHTLSSSCKDTSAKKKELKPLIHQQLLLEKKSASNFYVKANNQNQESYP